MRSAATRLGGLVAALLIAFGWLLVASPSAYASGEDAFDRFDVSATLGADGSLSVRETIVLRFGANSGRHGLERVLTTREPDPDTGKDMVFKVDQVSVQATSGASDQVELTPLGEGRRSQGLRIRVGRSDVTIAAPTATYVLSYRVLGLVRSPGGADQLYWDVGGSQMPLIVQASAQISVPGGAQRVFCSVAAPGQRGACRTSSIGSDKVAHFDAENIAAGQVMTVGVGIQPGLVSPNTPILEDDLEQTRDGQVRVAEAFGRYSLAISCVAAALTPVVGFFWVRRKTADLRFVGLPPGVLPIEGEPAPKTTSRTVEVPVAFNPPPVSVSEAGYLLYGQIAAREMAATLVGLAVAGAVRLGVRPETTVTLVDMDKAPDAPSAGALRRLFPNKAARKAGKADLSDGSMLGNASTEVRDVVRKAATEGSWFARMPTVGSDYIDGIFQAIWVVGGTFAVSLVPFVLWGVIGQGIFLTIVGMLPLAAVGSVTWTVVSRKLAVGQRGPVGSALVDQVRGFRTYLATAEADQLRFEEGEDIFSKYLPWAIVFDLTERWTQVCQRLVALGRLSDAAPGWYAGAGWDLSNFNLELSDFRSQVSEATGPTSSSSSYSSSGSGFGSGGSAFSSSDGGFSGGGGGGGGGGSW